MLLFVKVYITWSDLLFGGSLIVRRSVFWIAIKVFTMIDGLVVYLALSHEWWRNSGVGGNTVGVSCRLRLADIVFLPC